MTTNSATTGDFFLVGGPVQPDRPCYLERAADRQLRQLLAVGEHCYVLAPRQSGKTSLMARAARNLRREHRLVAAVDLNQIGSRDKQHEPQRWYYGLVYRIVRDLRLKVDLQTWWRNKDNLPEPERLVEFFWEVVLANTTAPVVVFLDDVEALEDLPYAGEFLASLRACHDRRATEPDFLRLTFVLLGVTSPARLIGDHMLGPFQVARRIDLRDFTEARARSFAAHLGLPTEQARQALKRVIHWTGGQPYLTQKLCRAIARQGLLGDAVEGVDALVAALYLSANAMKDEPNLNGVRSRMLGRDEGSQAVLTLYGRLCKGARISVDQSSEVQRQLTLSGLVTEGRDGYLTIRNPIYATVFTARWVNQSLPFKWRIVAMAAGATLLAVLLPLWYTQVLPRPYVDILSTANEDFDRAAGAYRSLHRIPGFADTADRLMVAFLERRILSAPDFGVARQALDELRGIPGQEQLAALLRSEFWQGRARLAEMQEQRDEAILYRLRALEGGDEWVRRELGGLVLDDYPLLLGTIRPSESLGDAVLSVDGATVTTLTGGNRVRHWNLSDGEPRGERALSLLAQEFIPVTRSLNITQEGEFTGLELTVTVNHTRPEDLYLILTSPAGTQAVLDMAAAGEAKEIDYIFNTTTYALNTKNQPSLTALRGETRQGLWTLTVEDQEDGVTGTLESWGLQFTPAALDVVKDVPDTGLVMPDPTITNEVRVVLGPSGRIAAATGANELLRGYILTWDLQGSERLARIPHPAGSPILRFAAQGEVLIVAGTDSARVKAWHARTGRELFGVDLPGRFAAPPELSPDGRFLLASSLRPEGGSVLQVWDIERGASVATAQLDTVVTQVALAPGGTFAALASRDNLIRVWHFGRKETVADLFHQGPVTRLALDSQGRWLAMTSRDGMLYVWDREALHERTTAPVLETRHWDPDSLVFGSRDDEILVQSSPTTLELIDLATRRLKLPPLRHGRVAAADQIPPGFAVFAPDAPLLLTGQRDGFLRVWEIPEEAMDPERLIGAPVSVISPDGRLIATADDTGGLQFARLGEAGVLEDEEVSAEPLRGHAAAIRLLEFSPNGEHLVSSAADGSIRIWEVATRVARDLTFRNDLGTVLRSAISNDGNTLLTAGVYGARVWSARSGEKRFDLAVGPVSGAVALSQDGTLVALQTAEGEVQVLDASSGELLQSIPSPRRLSVLAIDPDGRRLVLASRGGSVEFWDLEPGQAVGTPLELGGPLVDVYFSQNGRSLVMRSKDWLHLAAVTGAGLVARASRLVAGDIARGRPHFREPGGEVLLVATEGPESVMPMFLDFDARNQAPLDGPVEALLSEWPERLKLKFTADGQVVHATQPAPQNEATPGSEADSTASNP